MPRKPPHPCGHPGCHELVRDGSRCEKHRKQAQRFADSFRPNASARGYTSTRWRAFREVVKRREPWCRECRKEGRFVLMTDLDHIVPVSGPDDPKFLDCEAVQPLCHRCHSQKTSREDGGFRGKHGS